MEKIDKNEKQHNSRQTLMIILTLLAVIAYGVCVVLFWDYDWWNAKFAECHSGLFNVFQIAFYIVANCFHSWLSAGIFIAGPIVLGCLIIVVLSKQKGKYMKGYSILTYTLFNIAWPVGIVASIVASFMKDMHIATMVSVIGCGIFLLMLFPFIALCKGSGMCKKCGCYGKQKIDSKSYSGSYETYVPGGYKYNTYDVKDESGNKVGTLETKKYEEGHYKTNTYSTEDVCYRCINCGEEDWT